MTLVSWAFRRSSVRRRSARRGEASSATSPEGRSERRTFAATSRVSRTSDASRERRGVPSTRATRWATSTPPSMNEARSQGRVARGGPPHRGRTATPRPDRAGRGRVGARPPARSATASDVRAKGLPDRRGIPSGCRPFRRATPSADPAYCWSSNRIRSNSNALKELAFTHQARLSTLERPPVPRYPKGSLFAHSRGPSARCWDGTRRDSPLKDQQNQRFVKESAGLRCGWRCP